MAVITISRQLGSWGSDVARLVAERLGYRMVEREVINRSALRAGSPELALAMIDELNLLRLCPSDEECQAYVDAVEVVMRELAAAGNIVIVGRAGQVILAQHPGALHVRLIAPEKVRAERLAQQKNISFQAALANVRASDRYRRNYLKRFYQQKWDDPELYDLLINTARLPVEAAAGLICQAALNKV